MDQESTVSIGHIIGWVLFGGVSIAALVTFLKSWTTIEQQTIGIVERFGAFDRQLKPGLHFLLPFVETWDDIDLRVQQMVIDVETKTKDDVTVKIRVSVQYQVPEAKAMDAYYKLEDPKRQITAYVFNAVRAHVPSQTLDEVYANKQLDKAIEAEVREKMSGYGYDILDAPVSDITPDAKVKDAMNQVNANQRLFVAAQSKGEADKVLKVKAAEADAESKALQGSGIARERLAIAEGLKNSAVLFEQAMKGVSPEECMAILLLTQYFDMLKDIGAKSNTIMLPHAPAGLPDLMGQIRNAVIAGQEAASWANGSDKLS